MVLTCGICLFDTDQLERVKKVRKNSSQSEAGSSSSGNSSFVALVKASNLKEDALVRLLKLFSPFVNPFVFVNTGTGSSSSDNTSFVNPCSIFHKIAQVLMV